MSLLPPATDLRSKSRIIYCPACKFWWTNTKKCDHWLSLQMRTLR